MNIYLDESGDLGWSFDKPYRHGGSSRFLTIAFIACPSEKKFLLQRVVRAVYSYTKTATNEELKGSSMTTAQKNYVARQVRSLLKSHPDIKIGAITVRKQNVDDHIREDSNKLYNFMIKLALLPVIKDELVVNLIRDNKSIKVKSGNSLIDYLQITLWFDMKVKTKIVDFPMDSKKVQNLIFVDWINNIVWGHYEDGNSEPFNILGSDISSQTLFFH